MKEYRYFTYARINGKKQKDAFGDPVDHWLAFNPKKTELTLHLILGKRVTVVTSRFVDAISAGVGHRPLLGVYAQMERWIKQLPTTNGAWHVQESRILQHP